MTNREMFIQAFQAADAIETEKYLNKAAFTHEFSAAFEKKMNKLIAKNNRISLYTRSRISKALIAAIIVLVVMFTGLMSVSATREKVLEFAERIFPSYTQVTLSENSSETLDTIETEYTISNIPDGFTLSSYDKDEFGVFAIWQNDKGERIMFAQDVLDSDKALDNEHNYQKIMLNGYPAYYNIYELETSLTWTNGEYWFEIKVPNFYKNELLSMAEKISEKN